MSCDECEENRARAGVLARALYDVADHVAGEDCYSFHLYARELIAAVPEDVLAERNALERCAAALRRLLAGHKWSAWWDRAVARQALADLDACRPRRDKI